MLFCSNGMLWLLCGYVWKCWVNIPNEIAISKRDNDQQNHWVQWGTRHFQTHPCIVMDNVMIYCDIIVILYIVIYHDCYVLLCIVMWKNILLQNVPFNRMLWLLLCWMFECCVFSEAVQNLPNSGWVSSQVLSLEFSKVRFQVAFSIQCSTASSARVENSRFMNHRHRMST